MILIGQTFVDTALNLDGHDIHGCLFDGCVLELTEDAAAFIEHCQFEQCLFIGNGWPGYITAQNPAIH